MKKIVIPVIAFFIITIGGIIFSISINYTKVQFGKDTMFHMMTIAEGGTLTAEYKDIKTNVVGRNLQRINSVLGVSAINRVYGKTEYDENEAVYLYFSDGAKYIVAPDPEVSDGAFIIYSYKNKNLAFRVKGYNSMTWVKKAISPSGIYNRNEIIEE